MRGMAQDYQERYAWWMFRRGGLFVTYQNTPVLQRLLGAYFVTLSIARLVLRNVRHAQIFVCRCSV